MKKLHSNVVTEEGALELGNLVSQLISPLLLITGDITGPGKNYKLSLTDKEGSICTKLLERENMKEKIERKKRKPQNRKMEMQHLNMNNLY